MRLQAGLLALLFTALSAVSAWSEEKMEGKMSVLETLKPAHPRIIALDEDWQRIRALVDADPAAAELRDSLYGQALKMLDQPPVEHKLEGPRLLSQSRKCLERVYTLATVYRLTGKKSFAERAVREMLAAAAFPDWNPSHFLDTAEMTHALAIGCDWLYDFIEADDRVKITTAIIEKGLKPSLPLYEKESWQVAGTHNWNQVCNGGLVIGALAVADDEPELAAHIIEKAVQLLPNAMAEYADDGGWPEGPGYWGYGGAYNVYLLAALETALGTDHGLSSLPGFSRTGFFPVYFTGPLGLTFNYADCRDRVSNSPQMRWLARKFNQPAFARFQREHMHSTKALDLVWYDPQKDSPAASTLPLDALFRNVDVAFFRSAWEDPDAVFVGFKGGDNQANHSHLDLGSFVLDAGGHRWAVDLGADNYNLPGYWDRADGGARWKYFRLGTRSHNTITFAGANQYADANAPIISFVSTPERAHAVADLTDAYRKWAASIRRGIALLDRKQVLIVDEIQATTDTEIVWTILTPARVDLHGDRATLTQNGWQLEAQILEPEGLKFEIAPAAAPETETQQEDTTVLSVTLPGKPGSHRLAVLLTPHPEDQPPPTSTVPVPPLDDWLDK